LRHTNNIHLLKDGLNLLSFRHATKTASHSFLSSLVCAK
jgi:hypothetical protein